MGNIPGKKVVNADAGDADHLGGNDWDDLVDYTNNVDKTGPVKINTRTYFRSGKRELRNPADTFSYIETAGAIVADRIVNEPVLTGTDTRVYEAHAQTLTNKTIDNKTNPILLQSPYKYTIFQDGSDTKCLNHDTGTIVSTNTDDDVVIQYAIDNAAGAIIFIKRGLYTCNSVLDGVDKDVCIIGERNRSATLDASDVIIKKSHADTLLSVNNTEGTYHKVFLKDIILDGNDGTGTGVLANSIRFNQPCMENVFIRNCDIGLKISSSWYSNFINLQIENCVTYGIHMTNDGTPATLQKGCNTLYFFGGRITDCNTSNLYLEVSNDAAFYSMILENAEVSTNHILTTNRTIANKFYGCSMEFTHTTSITVISENGGNNCYHGLRFGSGNVNYTAINFGSTCRRSSMMNCDVGGDSTKTVTINIDAAAQDVNIIGNGKNSWIAPTITVTDSGVKTTRVGNSFCDDKFGHDVSFAGNLTISGAKNIALSTSTGTKIGTGTTQLLGFYNAAPVSQRTGMANVDASTVDTTYGTEESNVITSLRTKLNAVIQILEDLGFISIV